jgi:hypothetical protein
VGVAGEVRSLDRGPAAREKARQELLKEENQQALAELQLSMSAILAKAQSADPWTSRARASFLYVFYLILIVLILIAPLVGIAYPAGMAQFYSNVATGFAAIPDVLWRTFAIGYLGYAGARTMEKKWGVSNEPLPWRKP